MNELEKDLKRKLDTLCTQYRKTTSMKTKRIILEIIKGIYGVADDFNLSIDSSRLPLIDNFNKQIKGFNMQYEETFWNMYDINERLALLSNEIYSGYFSNKYQVHLNDADINEYVYGFFDTFDESIANHFVKQIKRKNIWMFENFYKGNYMGETMRVNSYGESYILLKSFHNVQDVIFLAHELIHSYGMEYIWRLSNYEKNQYLINNLQEVYSIFIEFAITKFLEENGFNKKDINTSRNTSNDTFSNELILYNQYFNIAAYYPNCVNDEIINKYCYYERYALSTLIARYFYNIYIEDPEEGKRLLEKFIKDIPKKEKHILIQDHINIDNLFDKEKIIIK